MLQYFDSYSQTRNGKPLPIAITEDVRVESLDVQVKTANFRVTLTSYIARASKVKKEALLADPLVRNFLFDGDILAEISIPDKNRLINAGTSASTLSHAKKRAFAELAEAVKPIIRDNSRSQRSYRCELAAIVLATYGRLSSIPKAILAKIEDVFGCDVIQDPETRSYRKQMATYEAKNWFRHMADIEEIFDFANIDKNDVVDLTA